MSGAPDSLQPATLATSGEVQILIAIAELKGSLTTLQNVDKDHEGRIRVIEAKPIPDPETEKRLRSLEGRRTISPAQLWLGLLGLGGLLGSIATVVAVVWR